MMKAAYSLQCINLWSFLNNSYINTAVKVYSDLLVAMDDEASRMGLVSMYHSCLDDETETMVLTGFSRGRLRCVVATVAFGMGVNVQDIRRVYHYGLPDSVLEYWQEAGRASRDGRGGQAVLYRARQGPHKTNAGWQRITNSCEDNSCQCLRHAVLTELWLPEMGTLPPISEASHSCQERPCKCTACSCCSLCRGRCPCYAD